MREITQYRVANQQIDNSNSDPDFPDQFNHFYSRFDQDNDTVPVSEPIEEGTPPALTSSEHDVVTSEVDYAAVFIETK